MATITTGSNSPEPRLYISTYYTILGESIFFKFETPNLLNQKILKITLDTGEENLSDLEKARLTLDLDPTTPILDNVTYTYKQVGKYFPSYTVTYQSTTNPQRITEKTFFLEQPITVLRSWPRFRQQDIRILGENILQLPFTFEQIQINPNEFGTSGVYNISLTRLHQCIEYLKSNTSILNSKTPSFYYGWLGVNALNRSNGLRWHTLNYLSEFYKEVTSASGFSNIKDIAETKAFIIVLDHNNRLNIYKNSNIPARIPFNNQDELLSTLTDIVSFDISDDGKILFVLDAIQNKVYRIDIDFDATNSLYQTYNPILSLTYNVGSYGDETDPFTFNNPIQILFVNNLLYVLDYNNQCIKSYTDKLDWNFTYKVGVFENDQPIAFAVQKDTRFLYVMSKTRIYVLPHRSNRITSTFNISNLQSLNPKKIFFDEAGEFFYIVTDNYIFKYTALGLYMDVLELPTGQSGDLLNFVTGKRGYGRNILIATRTAIIKCQEVTEILVTGQGLDIDYWTLDQILINPNELSQDLVINRALSRLCYNLVNFRNSLESKLLLASESTPAGVIEYFRLYPIKANLRPKLGSDVELNKVAVGVNELHAPSVVNRELKKIYDACLVIKKFLDIENITTESEIGRSIDKCPSVFCWSWKAMSTYDVKKPLIRTCNINPISFRELQRRFTNTNYVETKTWEEASSVCCSNVGIPKL
jgi:hypothetical protein